jgi:putative Mg2+ transporter-C (MgtC) family protein
MFISDYVADAPTLLSLLIKLGLSLFSGSIIGFERGRHGRSAGLRTHILVCLASTMASMIDLYMAATIGSDGTRIAANVLTGIGFLGAGVILIKRDFTITGLTTAAGLWATAVIGLCYGYGFCEIPLVATFVFLLTFALLPHLETVQKAVVSLYVEVDDLSCVTAVLHALHEVWPLQFQSEVVPAKSGNTAHIGIHIATHGRGARKFKTPEEQLRRVLDIPHVTYAVLE